MNDFNYVNWRFQKLFSIVTGESFLILFDKYSIIELQDFHEMNPKEHAVIPEI
jgi:hypothetical protein